MIQAIRDGIVLTIGILVGLFTYEHFAYGRESNVQKWERIQKNRGIRRVNEARFEACAVACMETCREK